VTPARTAEELYAADNPNVKHELPRPTLAHEHPVFVAAGGANDARNQRLRLRFGKRGYRFPPNLSHVELEAYLDQLAAGGPEYQPPLKKAGRPTVHGDLVVVSASISIEQRKALWTLASARDVTFSEAVRVAVEALLARPDELWPKPAPKPPPAPKHKY
jgi:hypothetical protein